MLNYLFAEGRIYILTKKCSLVLISADVENNPKYKSKKKCVNSWTLPEVFYVCWCVGTVMVSDVHGCGIGCIELKTPGVLLAAHDLAIGEH